MTIRQLGLSGKTPFEFGIRCGNASDFSGKTAHQSGQDRQKDDHDDRKAEAKERSSKFLDEKLPKRHLRNGSVDKVHLGEVRIQPDV